MQGPRAGAAGAERPGSSIGLQMIFASVQVASYQLRRNLQTDTNNYALQSPDDPVVNPHAQSPWSQAVTRRAFLRGTGISLALPWLESLPLRAADTGEVVAKTASTRPPVRFACLYFSNGVKPAH